MQEGFYPTTEKSMQEVVYPTTEKKTKKISKLNSIDRMGEAEAFKAKLMTLNMNQEIPSLTKD